jgi:hypothetical protein
MKKLATIGCLLAAVMLVTFLLLPVGAFDGRVPVQFRFHIVESDGGYGIGGAKVRVVEYSRLSELSDTNLADMFPVTATDAAGLATVSVGCGAGWSVGLFGKRGRFIISHELLVEADGYRSISTGLANVVGGRRWPLSKRAFDVELVMSKNP